MKYLDEQTLLEINKQAVLLVGASNYGVKDADALDMIVKGVEQEAFGVKMYPDVYDAASFYMQKITKKHPFVDGNKRTSVMTAFYFLNLNGIKLDIEKANKSGDFVVDITNSPDSKESMDEIVNFLRSLTI